MDTIMMIILVTIVICIGATIGYKVMTDKIMKDDEETIVALEAECNAKNIIIKRQKEEISRLKKI